MGEPDGSQHAQPDTDATVGEPDGSQHAQPDTERAEAFSDGVLAIIITLLVLDLRVPDTKPGQLLSGLIQQWPAYLAYVTSYLYVAVVWLNHRAAFKRIAQVDRGLYWHNLWVLFTTALLPFPTSVVSKAIQEGNVIDGRTAVGFYALVGALLSLSWLRFFQHLARHPELHERGVDERFFRRERLRPIAGLVLNIVGGVIGVLTAPWIALVIFLAVVIFYGITSYGLYHVPNVVNRMSDGF